VVNPGFEPYLREARENPPPASWAITPAESRQAFRDEAMTLRGELSPMTSVTDHRLALEGRDLNSRLYVPVTDDRRALIIFFHGGSFVRGDLDTHDWLCRRLAHDTRTRLLAVDYRLAPEHPFPAGLNDAVDVIRLVSAHRGDFGEPAARVIIMGDSAGANLVAVAATEVRDDEPAVAAQVLIYPTLGPELVTDSAHRYGKGFLLDLDGLRYDYGQYLGEYGDHTDPRITPLLSTDLARVAPAVVVVAEFDPLRDEGVAYAGLLEHFGVAVELLEARGMIHGFLEMGAVVPDALEILDDLAAHVQRVGAGTAT